MEPRLNSWIDCRFHNPVNVLSFFSNFFFRLNSFVLVVFSESTPKVSIPSRAIRYASWKQQIACQEGFTKGLDAGKKDRKRWCEGGGEGRV